MDSINKLYNFLDSVTPLDYDCGKICSSKCCKGNSDNGMILFPGEELKFSDRDNFKIFYDERYDCNIITCNGTCDRKNRPISCRIFPFMFYKTEINSPVRVAADIRAVEFCPILENQLVTDKKFQRAMRISAKYIENDSELSDFIFKLTSLLTDTNGL